METPTPFRHELLNEALRERLSREFADFIDRQSHMSEAEEASLLLKTFGGDRDKMQNAMKEQKAKTRELYSDFSDYKKMARVMNNFHAWFPGGSYRSPYDSREKKDEKKATLLRDIDEYIQSRPAEEQKLLASDSRSMSPEKRNEWLAVTFPMFCAMKDKGHNAELLWR